MRRLVLTLALLWSFITPVEAINPDLLTKPWTARWISAPDSPAFDFGVYHFRRAFELASAPQTFVVHVTADNRYQLFVNGERVAWGPARGDLYHWRYETVDIARHLRAGSNTLAAVVWNFGQYMPIAQVSQQTGFLLQGDTAAERIVDTGPAWKCARDEAYSPAPTSDSRVQYYAAGPTEHFDAALYPWGWEQPGFDDRGWKAARAGRPGYPREASDAPNRWMLVPRPIPMMEERPQRLARVRQASGAAAPEGFPARPVPVRVPANTTASLLLDQDQLTTAYPELVFSGGKGARVSIGYAESLFTDPAKREKGNRNEVEGKQFVGVWDSVVADGGANRLYRPLWWRTYRYLKLEVVTQGEPLTIEDLRGVYTGYPFERKARLEAGSAELERILEVGWHTARLCAHETYMDCPYYEQLQYVGDTRIQALVSLYMTGDGRLMRNAIELINASRTAEGATYSRAPSSVQQYIPPFSLWWVGMVHDYYMYQDDPEFVRRMLPGVRAVLSYFSARQSAGGTLGPLPWWNFVDWVGQWRSGVPPAGEQGGSAPLDLQLLLAYQWAAHLEEGLGSQALAREYRQAAAALAAAVRQTYWDSSRQLFADTPLKRDYSQHANALAVLAGLLSGEPARALMERTLHDASLAQATIYFRHYLHSALGTAGLGDRYLDMLDEWRTMLGRGLTTWAEHADPVRSDCHAWGASPNYELFHTVLGIDSAAPGFRRVVLRPALGGLAHVSGSIPHPQGEIAVSFTRDGSRLRAEISLPAGVQGEIVWNGRKRLLPSGKSTLLL
jgi:hypothetical protein